MGESFHLVYLSLGTNLGNREENMRRALRQLSLCVGPLERVSSFIDRAVGIPIPPPVLERLLLPPHRLVAHGPA